jgi:hypothetical protein
MVIFAECPECHESVKAIIVNDIRKLEIKDKSVIPVSCQSCNAPFEISIKLKAKKKGHPVPSD